MAKKMIDNGEALHIPQNSAFNGDIQTENNARIEGTVKGNIISQGGNLLFGVESVIDGNVTGGDIAIGGKVNGDIMATGQVSIFSGAKVIGNVKAASFVVESNAAFDGHVLIEAPEPVFGEKESRRAKARAESTGDVN